MMMETETLSLKKVTISKVTSTGERKCRVVANPLGMYRYDFVRRREVAAYKNANPKMMRACFPEILKFVFRIQSIMPSKIEENRNR